MDKFFDGRNRIVLAGRMKNKVYTKEIDNQIISHENRMN